MAAFHTDLFAKPVSRGNNELLLLPLTSRNEQLGRYIYTLDLDLMVVRALKKYPDYFDPESVTIAYDPASSILYIMEFETHGAIDLHKVDLELNEWTLLYKSVYKTGICYNCDSSCTAIYVTSDSKLNVIGPQFNSMGPDYLDHHYFNATTKKFECTTTAFCEQERNNNNDQTNEIELIEDALIIPKNDETDNVLILKCGTDCQGNEIKEIIGNKGKEIKHLTIEYPYDVWNGAVHVRGDVLITFGEATRCSNHCTYIGIIKLSSQTIKYVHTKLPSMEHFYSILIEDKNQEKKICYSYVNVLFRTDESLKSMQVISIALIGII